MTAEDARTAPQVELPDECDFCDQPLDEDEELVPVYVGEPPTPKPRRLQGFAKHHRATRTSGYMSRQDLRDVRIYGHTVGEFAALLNALQSADGVDITMSPEVREVRSIGGERHMVSSSPDTPSRVETDLNREKAGARINIDAEHEPAEPDLMLCEYCAESFTDGA